MPYKHKPVKLKGTNWTVRCVNKPEPPIPLKLRFEDKFDIVESGCWEWNSAISDTGYGAFTANGKTNHAHRFSYELYVGKIPDGLLICHKCDNKKCVNPNHFFLGTDYDNLLDARQKGIMKTAKCPSRSMYNNGCRCEGCKRVQNEDSRRRRRNKHWGI